MEKETKACTESKTQKKILKKRSGPSCSKLMTSLVNISLKFHTSVSEICQYFLLKNCAKRLQCKIKCDKLHHCMKKKQSNILHQFVVL